MTHIAKEDMLLLMY